MTCSLRESLNAARPKRDRDGASMGQVLDVAVVVFPFCGRREIEVVVCQREVDATCLVLPLVTQVDVGVLEIEWRTPDVDDHKDRRGAGNSKRKQ